MLLGDALTSIGDGHLHLIIHHIQVYIYPTATRGKLQRIRQQIAHYLFQFIAIGPGHQLVLHTKATQRQSLFLRIKLEGVADIVHQLHHIKLFHTQPQRIVLQFIKVHQLVDQFEHALDAALGNAQQTALLVAHTIALCQLPHRTGNHR